MISNINHTPLRTFQSISDYWKRGNIYKFKTINYPELSPDRHYADGWREVVIPTIGENQRRGEIFYDAANDVVTYSVIDFTEEEIKANFLAQAESERESKIQEIQRKQLEESVQVVADDKEALDKKAVFPIWEKLEDGFEFKTDFKVQALEGKELKLFKIIQPHAKQSDRQPNLTPALWSKIEFSAGIEVWAQPTGGDGKYPFLNPATGKAYEVTHKGSTWENTHKTGLNVWEPGVFGWKIKV